MDSVKPPLPRGRWTNGLLTVNTLVFLAVSVTSGQLFSPAGQTLIDWGAKDPVAIAQGEFWRFLSPIFLHIGLVHFALNSLALRYIGCGMEALIGPRWFLFIYLATGVAGNIASTLGNVEVGAGASGAIFGLIGVGVVFEWLLQLREVRGGLAYRELGGLQSAWHERLRLIPGPYSSMALLNIALALGINFVISLSEDASIGIDNAAHLGGLAAGIVLGFALLCLRPNGLLRRRRLLGVGILGLFAAVLVLPAYRLTHSDFIKEKYQQAAEASSDPRRAFGMLSRGLEIEGNDAKLRLARGRLLLLHGEYAGLADLQDLPFDGATQASMEALALELARRGQPSEAAAVSKLVRARELAPKS